MHASIPLRYLLLLVAVCAVPAASANSPQAFRVCADPNNLPFSARSLDGLENQIAALWARKLGMPLEYTWFPQRRGFVRNTLRAWNDAGTDYKCDVVMGVPVGSELLLTTSPYYRSTYALVYVKGRKLDGVSSAKDFINLHAEVRNGLRIGAFTPTPGVTWLARYGMTEQTVAFPAMSGDPETYPGQIIEKELTDGSLDAAVVWGPIAGYFAKVARGVELAVIPLESEPGIRFDFAISAGVRYGDGERKRQLEALMRETSAAIHEILVSYHVPLLDLNEASVARRPEDDD